MNKTSKKKHIEEKGWSDEDFEKLPFAQLTIILYDNKAYSGLSFSPSEGVKFPNLTRKEKKNIKSIKKLFDLSQKQIMFVDYFENGSKGVAFTDYKERRNGFEYIYLNKENKIIGKDR